MKALPDVPTLRELGLEKQFAENKIPRLQEKK
jgi:hypothetical protein